MHPHLASLVVLTAMTATALWGYIIYTGLAHDITHRPPMNLFVWLVLFLGGVLLSSLGAIVFGMSVFFWRRQRFIYTLIGAAVGVFFIPTLFLTGLGLNAVVSYSERAAFQKIGLISLRQAAADLVRIAPRDETQIGYFGYIIPDSLIQPVLRQAIPKHAIYTVVDDQGITIVTGGREGWSEGYQIMPPGSLYEPPNSRKIADGFFYVIAGR